MARVVRPLQTSGMSYARSQSQTIAAVATPPGRGGIGVIRISGPETPRIAEQLLGEVPSPRQAALRIFRDPDGEMLYAGIALFFPSPASFTVEDLL